MTANKNRAELIKELEQIFNKRVFAIVFNRDMEDGIKEGDEIYISHFIDQIIKKEGVLDCVLILNGPGGNLKTAILCSQLLRNNLKRYDTFVPTVVGSALCYFVLQSDKLLIGEASKLTQMDPMFYYQGEELRAIKHLNNTNQDKSFTARSMFNPVFENLRRIIMTPPHVFDKEVSKTSQKKTHYLNNLVDFWMGKEFHESGISKSDMEKVKINFKLLNSDTVSKAKDLVNECAQELQIENHRFVIQTNKVEQGYFGGFFHP